MGLLNKMRALLPKAMERLESEIESENGWKVALEITKMAGLGYGQISNIGHDQVDNLLREIAEKRMTDELFSTPSDY